MALRIYIDDRGDGCFSGCLGLFAFAGWLTAVIRDVMTSKWLWLIFDVFLAPLGAIRGWLMWFGLA